MLPLWSRIDERVADAAALYHRLVLAVGSARTGKTGALTQLSRNRGWPRVNVNLRLAERLLELTQKQRAVRVAGLLEDVVVAADSDVVLLDNIEMLFAAELSQDPLRLLQGLSRNRTVVVSWPGGYDGQTLTYAEPGHREYKKYVDPPAIIVTAADSQPTDVTTGLETNR